MNFSRRKFLQSTGTLVLSSAVLSGKAASSYLNMIKHPVGVQLFTFFNVIDSDVKGTLTKIAAAGYKELESAFSKKGGYYGMKPKEFKAMANGLGLSWKSHHVLGAPFKLPAGAKMPTTPDGKPMVIPPMKNLQDDMQQLVDEAAEGGVKYLVCANTPTGSMEELKASIAVLNKTAEAATKAGLIFAYHNHDAEFRILKEGVIPYDMLLSETDPQKMKMELDLAWAIKAGKNPVDLFKQNPGRFPLWHVKDLDAGKENILPVGSGTIDFKPIFAAALTAGMQSFFVEHDMPKDAFASINSSMQYISKNINV
ncbi:sugar phosphate isomerase/epimerase family protein [Mucilaginibacter phyllosphaerae]|uniref:Sugar phosphate isomerase/epimerase n=1 Tax=Mucilaginibacter phyllosphaerae TaxID=1812349 RepID=A0A4Y8A8L4_9SPHI|nr:sugar phosphate isomerase/epimerase [Mucilaginibacter phyllosphaerae]MBB3970861.1 sugar phosphate isomerase/epimerase [Mucilaginibacter phyllosphaerae]TEW64204.1 sugar phosphate isomerase/epimerase [Mucilaginibacter phyllosphaerae]GGH05058.1 AP endonuclease [Mucilaginibacter phyllosphaerae]